MKAVQTISAAIAVAFATGARGSSIPFTVFENTSGQTTPGVNLTLDVVDQGAQADLVFRNQSSIASVITEVYIESTAISSALLSSATIISGGGSQFHIGANPSTPSSTISSIGGPWEGTLISFGADSPSPHNGIAPGGSLTVRFTLGGSFTALVSALSSNPEGFRVAERIKNVGPGGDTISAVSTPVPEPGSAAMTFFGAAGFSIRRRRSA